jgi:hypothetical protein
MYTSFLKPGSAVSNNASKRECSLLSESDKKLFEKR